MDKAVEELQQELKLLKNEIKETLTDVREVLLNTVENPFPQNLSAVPMPAASDAPAAPPPPPPAPEAAQPAATPEQPPAQQNPAMPDMSQMPQMPQMPQMGQMGQMPQMPQMPGMQMTPQMPGMQMPQGPIVLGNAGGPGMPAQSTVSQQPEQMDAGYAEDADFDEAPPSRPSGGPGLPPSSRGVASGRRGKGPAASGRKPKGGPGLSPYGSRGPARGAGGGSGRRSAGDDDYDDEPRGNRARSGRGRSSSNQGPQSEPRGRRMGRDDNEAFDDGYEDEGREERAPRRKRGRPARPAAEREYARREYDDYDDEYYEDEYGDEYDEYEDAPEPKKGKVDMVVLASLSPWLTEGVYQLGRKRVRSLLEVYASMGGITKEMKDVLLQIVSLDDTEGPEKPVAIHDTMKFLIELDDLMWRGRQDWRRAALMSMIGTSQLSLDVESA